MGPVEEAKAVQKKDPAKAEAIYKQVVQTQPEAGNDAGMRDYETAVVALGELYRDNKRTNDLVELVKTSRTVLSSFAKAKVSKLIRQMLDLFKDIPETLDVQISITQSCIEWAIAEKRSFLRQNLESRLVALYLQRHAYKEALDLINALLKELKRLDDKMVLVEVQLLESRVYHALRNIPKARASLTSARTSANAVYCPPLMQAGLDMQSGILHTEDKDYNTAYSYFIEALEGYSGQDETAKAVASLKYMLLTKIMLNATDDVASIVTGKQALKYAGRDLEAMKAVARAHANRSLAEFEAALDAFRPELFLDPFIKQHFTQLYDQLLEHNIIRVIEPFSRVEIDHVARLVGLPRDQVQGKLSQMILDKMFSGVLDEGEGCLIVFDEVGKDQAYDAAIKTIRKLKDVVEVLYTSQASLLE